MFHNSLVQIVAQRRWSFGILQTANQQYIHRISSKTLKIGGPAITRIVKSEHLHWYNSHLQDDITYILSVIHYHHHQVMTCVGGQRRLQRRQDDNSRSEGFPSPPGSAAPGLSPRSSSGYQLPTSESSSAYFGRIDEQELDLSPPRMQALLLTAPWIKLKIYLSKSFKSICTHFFKSICSNFLNVLV